MQIKHSRAPIGSWVEGLSLRDVPDAAGLEKIEDWLEARGVLVFADQELTPAEQVAFSRAMGPLEPTRRVQARLEGFPEIFVVGNSGELPVTFSPKEADGALEWHTDFIHLETPARASMLYALETPPEGADTLFACMYEAYDSLSDADKRLVEPLRAVHSIHGLRRYLASESVQGVNDGIYAPTVDAVSWPLVRKHPRSGRKSLYFGSHVTVGIAGWPDDEAQDLIKRLAEHATQEAHRYRHQWSPGEVVLWDNRRVLHAGTYYDIERYRRRLHRTTLLETQMSGLA